MNHIIELVMAVGKCFHYPGDCGKIALFCNKNYTPHSFSTKRPSFSALNNILSSPSDHDTEKKRIERKKD